MCAFTHGLYDLAAVLLCVHDGVQQWPKLIFNLCCWFPDYSWSCGFLVLYLCLNVFVQASIFWRDFLTAYCDINLDACAWFL